MITLQNGLEKNWRDVIAGILMWSTTTECFFCKKILSSANRRRAHERMCMDYLDALGTANCSTKVNLHLSKDDVFCKSVLQPAIVQTRGMKKSLRKEGQRFHRDCLRAKAASKVRRAKRFGWIPKSDVRHLGDNQH
jgi:hypothetical protein